MTRRTANLQPVDITRFTAPAKGNMDEFRNELIAAFAHIRQISHGDMLNTREIWLECLGDVARAGGVDAARIVLRKRLAVWGEKKKKDS